MSRHPEAVIGRRHRFVAVLAAVTLGLLGALIPVTSASAAGGFSARLVDQIGQPAAGVEVQMTQRTGTGTPQFFVTTDANGEFGATGLTDGSYEAFVSEGTVGTGGQIFGVAQASIVIDNSSPDVAFGDIEIKRFVSISGTITNWSLAMGDVVVHLFHETSPGNWQQTTAFPYPEDVSTDGTFELFAPLDDLQYTLRFMLDSEASPYTDAFLGGAYEPETATHLTGVAGVGLQPLPIEMELGDAAVISGRVTSGGVPLAGIEVSAENDDDYAYDETDASGNYALYVRPGSDYMVYTYGDNDYAGMTYDGWDSCGCEFDPVSTTLLEPAEDIDFDLLEYGVGPEIIGSALDDNGDPVDDLEVKLYRASGGVWVLEDVAESYGGNPGDPNFWFLLDPAGVHRIQFVDDDGDILRVVDGARSELNGPGTQLSPLPACYAAAGDV